MERKLASIQQVLSVETIPNADRVEKAKVLGWELIVNKGQFKAGDPCVFFEIDSILPERPEFEFMRPRKFKVKTMKSPRLGVTSQGLAMSLDILPPLDKNNNKYIVTEGCDVTELLGVVKYEPPIPIQMMGKIKGQFPTHLVPKTDEMRVQSALGTLEELKGKEVYITVKEDGTSFTAYLNNGEFGVCSRNLELKEDETVYWKIAKQYDIENKLRKYGKNIAIQGEIVGDGINGNIMGLPRNQQQLHIFNIYDIENRSYVNMYDMRNIVGELEFELVQFDGFCIFDFTLDELLEMARGKYPNGNDREGIVIRPIKECYSTTLQGRLSIKVINNDYLVKHDT